MSTPLIIDIQANSQQAESAINSTNNKIKETEQVTADVSTKSAGKIGMFAGLWAKAFDMISNGLKSMVGWATDSQQSSARLGAVLKATGGEAGITSDKMKDLTNSLRDYTGSTTADVQNAQSVLLTFRKIGVDSFDRAQKAAADLAAVMQTDLKSSMLQVGKALEDPINGVTALRRAGVSFTQQQLEQIRVLQQSNEIGKAQALVLAEIEKQVGGAALALNSTDTGNIETMMNGLKDNLADVGKFLIKVVYNVASVGASVIKTLLPAIITVTAFITAKFIPALILKAKVLFSTVIPSLIATAKAAYAAMGPFGLLAGLAIGLVSIFARSSESVDDMTKSVDESTKKMDSFESSQKQLNKSVDDTIKVMSTATKGSKKYNDAISALIQQYPKLAEYGVSASSSIKDIQEAQAALNQEMEYKKIAEAAKQFDELSDKVEDATSNLSKAYKTYQDDPTKENAAHLQLAISTYNKLTKQVQKTGEIAGKTSSEIQKAITTMSFDAAITWNGSMQKMQSDAQTAATNIANTFYTAANYVKGVMQKLAGLNVQQQLDSLNPAIRLGEMRLRRLVTDGTGTPEQISTLRSKLTELKKLRDNLLNQQMTAPALQKFGKLDKSEYDLEEARYKLRVSMMEKFDAQRAESEKRFQEEVVKIEKATNLTPQQKAEAKLIAEAANIKTLGKIQKAQDRENARAKEKLMATINEGLTVANTVLGTLADGSKAIEERIFDSVMTIASQMGPQGQMVAGIMAVGKTLFNALKKSSKSALEQYREQLESITKEYQKQMESINASLNVAGKNDIALLEAAYQSAADASAAYFKSIGMANQSLSQEQLIEMQKTFNSFDILDFGNSNTNKLMRNARELGRKMGVELVDGTGQATQELYSGRANRQQLLKMFEGLLPESLMDATVSALVGKTWHQVLTQTDDVLKRLKDSIKDGLELTSEQREAFIAYQSAYTNQQIAELEHANKMGKYQGNDTQYQTDKIKLYDNLISVLKEEIDTNGTNYQLQMQLWGLEEERYSMQQAINQAKGVELGLTRNLNSEYMRGQMGFAQHYRNILASNLSNAGLSNLTLGNSPSVVYVNGSGGSTGDTTNYIINGVNFRNPAEAVNEMNNQKLYQTGRSWF